MKRSENLTVLLTDIANFSEKTAASSRADMDELMKVHNRLLKSTVRFYGGEYVKSTGDGMLAVFRTTTNAVQCGMAIQDTIAEYNVDREPEQQLHVRVALNLGEVSWTGRHDVVGEAVNVTARIEAITPPDEVYLSGTVYLAMNKAEVATRFVEKVRLKGVSEAVAIHCVPRHEKAVLVATGEAVDEPSAELPFGGMPRPSAVDKADQLRTALTQPWVIAVASMVLTALLLGTLAYRSGWLSPEGQEIVRQVFEPAPLFEPRASTSTIASTTDDDAADASRATKLLRAGEALLLAGNIKEARALLENNSNAEGGPPQMDLLRGHIAFEEKQHEAAIKLYQSALEAAPDLRSSDLLARNLVGTLGYYSGPAASLIEAHATPAMIDYLAQRTAQEGPIGRGHAVKLLQDLGKSARIDYFQHGRMSLTEARSCEQYKAAIGTLQYAGDPAAIPLLEKALGDGLGDWFRTRCWRGRAEAAIAALQSEG